MMKDNVIIVLACSKIVNDLMRNETFPKCKIYFNPFEIKLLSIFVKFQISKFKKIDL